MLQNQAPYPDSSQLEAEQRHVKDNRNQPEARFNQGLPPSRNKSSNIARLPIKAYQTSNDTSHTSSYPLATEPSYNNILDSARDLINRSRENAEKMLYVDFIRKKQASYSPQKRLSTRDNEESHNLGQSSGSHNKLESFSPYAVPVKSNSRSRIVIKAKGPQGTPLVKFGDVPPKQGVFNAEFIEDQQNMIPLRSRREQYLLQNMLGNYPLLKKNLPTKHGIEYISYNKQMGMSHMEREEAFAKQIENRNSYRKSLNEVKLPKLDYSNLSKKKSHADLTTSINSINVSLFNDHSNINDNKRQDTEGSIPSGNMRVVIRGKARSLDRNEVNNTNSQTKLLAPQNLSSQNQPTKHKKAIDTLKTSFARFPVNENKARNQAPSRLRTQSTMISKSHIASFSGIDLMEKKIIQNYTFKTRAGALPDKPVKTNQDAYIMHPNFAGHNNKYFFAVCDGHGVNGHIVSNFVKQNLPKNLENHYQNLPNEKSENIREMLTATFAKTNKELSESSIDTTYSGSTTVSLLISGTKLWSANVGDSRAIVLKHKNTIWSATPLSRDHKPDLLEEMERIVKSGGRVDTLRDHDGEPMGPDRVWKKNENIPGLAMSRSFGDKVAASVGVIAVPEIMEFELEEEDKLIVIASDGVWEFLSNEEVMDLIVPFYAANHLDSACDKVVKESTNRWKDEEEEVVDDITCIIINLKVPPKE